MDGYMDCSVDCSGHLQVYIAHSLQGYFTGTGAIAKIAPVPVN